MQDWWFTVSSSLQQYIVSPPTEEWQFQTIAIYMNITIEEAKTKYGIKE